MDFLRFRIGHHWLFLQSMAGSASVSWHHYPDDSVLQDAAGPTFSSSPRDQIDGGDAWRSPGFQVLRRPVAARSGFVRMYGVETIVTLPDWFIVLSSGLLASWAAGALRWRRRASRGFPVEPHMLPHNPPMHRTGPAV
jgi:hypothetical protein